MVLFEYAPDEIRFLPKHVLEVPPKEIGGLSLSFVRLLVDQKEYEAWFLKRDPRALTAVRDLRLSLLRLYAEQEVLKLVLRKIVGFPPLIVFHPKTEAGDVFQKYLRDTLMVLSRGRWHGMQQEPIRHLINAREAVVSDDQRTLLMDELGKARRQILQKLRSYINEHRPLRPAIYCGDGGTIQLVEQTLEGGATVNLTTLNIGDGNVFHGDVIAAGTIQKSFNRAAQSNKRDEEQRALKDLTLAVGKLCEKLGSNEAQATARDLEMLVSEATAEKPRLDCLESIGKRLLDAAKTVVEMVPPITKAVGLVLSLFGVPVPVGL